MKNLKTNSHIFLYPNNIWDYDEGNLKKIEKIWTGESIKAKNEKLQEKILELEKRLYNLNKKNLILNNQLEGCMGQIKKLKSNYLIIWEERKTILYNNHMFVREINNLKKVIGKNPNIKRKKNTKRNSKKKIMTLI
tara:strand:- start:19 stop:426 length:408 start_codon:yes stop_codon:yes gene_type:complete